MKAVPGIRYLLFKYLETEVSSTIVTKVNKEVSLRTYEACPVKLG